MPDKLRIIYMGTPEFAVPSLKILVENGLAIVGVITAPDKPAGRGLKLKASPVKEYALAQNIPIMQPTNLKDPAFLEELKSYRANLQIVVAFRMLPIAVWDLPEIGTFNLHASLLPQYRGAAPIHWAVMNGEKETGVTTFFLKHKIDTGDLIMQEKEPIHEGDTTGSLYQRLMDRGANLVLKTTRLIQKGDYQLKPQEINEDLKPAPKIHKETCEMDFSRTSWELCNFVRGLNPFPVAWTKLNGKHCKIHKVEPVLTPNPSAQSFVTDHKTFLHLKTADGWLSVLELQMEGKKRMNIEDFLRGNSLT